MRLALVVLTLTLAGPAGALAQERQEGPPPRLFLSPMGEPFRGGDGAAAWFARADADNDGRLTGEEFQADGLRLFRQLDTDGNGVLDGFELQAYERDVAPEITGLFYTGPVDEARDESLPRRPRKGFLGRGGRSPYAARGGAGRFSYLNIPQPVTGADADIDRRVTLDEWRRAAALRFDLLDKARTGALTPATLPPAPGAPARPR